MKNPVCILFLLCAMLSAFSDYPAERKVAISEGFEDLSSWEPLYFPKIKEHSEYRILKQSGESFLAAISNSSASALVHRKEFSIYDFPKARWRWKIDRVYEKGDASSKEGDDYPIRIYFMFKYDPDNASLGTRIKYGLAKKIYGEYPPHSSLNYIWANHGHDTRILNNPYTGRSKMVILETGADVPVSGSRRTWTSSAITVRPSGQSHREPPGLP